MLLELCRFYVWLSIGANVADVALNTSRIPTNFSVVQRLTSAWSACPMKLLSKRWEKNQIALLCILDSAKFACRGGVCGWQPINTKLKTKPSTARLDPKIGMLPSASLAFKF